MKNIYYLLLIPFVISCSVLFPDGVSVKFPDFSYNYQTFNKKLDYSDKEYLLNVTQFGESNYNNSSNLDMVVQFFKKKLNNYVTLKMNFKDTNGKLLIPFNINYDISKDHLKFLNESTNLNFIILSKIVYLKDIQNKSLTNVHKKRMYYSKAGAISFIKIVDVKNGEIVLEMNCTGSISNKEDKDIFSGEVQHKLNFHKNSYSLGEKTMKKLLNKIK